MDRVLLVGGSVAFALVDEEFLRDNTWALIAFNAVLVFGVPLATAVWYCRLATTSCIGHRWVLASTLAIAAASFCLKTQIRTPTAGPGTGSYMIGLGIAPSEFLQPAVLLQALVPCFVLLGFAARHAVMHRQLLRN